MRHVLVLQLLLCRNRCPKAVTLISVHCRCSDHKLYNIYSRLELHFLPCPIQTKYNRERHCAVYMCKIVYPQNTTTQCYVYRLEMDLECYLYVQVYHLHLCMDRIYMYSI